MQALENSDLRPLQEVDEDFGKNEEQIKAESQKKKPKSGFDWKIIAQEEDPYGHH